MELRSTLAMKTLIADRMTATQAQIHRLERQVASGQRAESYAELGTQAGINIALHNEAKTIETYQQNNLILATRLEAMDRAMMGIHDAAETVSTSAHAMTPNDTERNALINSATHAFSTVVNALQLAVGGRALFSGEETEVAPIVATVFSDLQTAIAGLATPTNATDVKTEIDNFFTTTASFYQGGDAIRPSAIDQNITVATGILASDPAFANILQGLATLALTPKPNGTDTTEAQYSAIVQAAAAQVANGVGQLNQLVSANGTRQALIEDTNTQLATSLTMVTEQINTIEQTDVAAAASRLSELRTQLEATYAMTSQLNQLSLVNYLK